MHVRSLGMVLILILLMIDFHCVFPFRVILMLLNLVMAWDNCKDKLMTETIIKI